MARITLGEVDTWYEENGEGKPLVLLHPGGADARAWRRTSTRSRSGSGC